MRDLRRLRTELGKRIQALRRRAGLTQLELGQRAGIGNEFVSRLEHGAGSPSLETLARLAQGLGVELGELFPRVQTGEAIEADSVLERLLRTAQRLELEDQELVLHLAEQVARARQAAGRR